MITSNSNVVLVNSAKLVSKRDPSCHMQYIAIDSMTCFNGCPLDEDVATSACWWICFSTSLSCTCTPRSIRAVSKEVANATTTLNVTSTSTSTSPPKNNLYFFGVEVRYDFVVKELDSSPFCSCRSQLERIWLLMDISLIGRLEISGFSFKFVPDCWLNCEFYCTKTCIENLIHLLEIPAPPCLVWWYNCTNSTSRGIFLKHFNGPFPY